MLSNEHIGLRVRVQLERTDMRSPNTVANWYVGVLDGFLRGLARVRLLRIDGVFVYTYAIPTRVELIPGPDGTRERPFDTVEE